MHRWLGLLVLGLLPAPWAWAQSVAEPLLAKLPPGIYVNSSMEVPAAQTQMIGQKLGAPIARLTNSVLQVHGRQIQVNVLTAVNETGAQTLFGTLSKNKPYPFCHQKGKLVVEFVGRDLDAALGLKTGYELGLIEKPQVQGYRIIAELATIDRADYMSCNPLFNEFLAVRAAGGTAPSAQLSLLSKKFTFGTTLVLRSLALDGELSQRQFEPAATSATDSGPSVSYTFSSTKNMLGVPYVTLSMVAAVPNTGFREDAAAPSQAATAASDFWPSEDARVISLAKTITAGQTSADGKTQAILAWLAPGKNVKYSGQVGSRYGTLKVLEQKFGHCWDFSDCFITLARAAGVPCRQVAGWLYGSSGHVWAEYYKEGQGWQQVDPTGGGQLPCGIYHIPYFTSETGEMPIVYVGMPVVEIFPLP